MDQDVGPTIERAQHDPIELLDRIADDAGRVSRPHRCVDILDRLYRRGAIDAEELQAGSDFRETFRRAHLDPLKAADASRPIVSGRMITLPGAKIEDARQDVWAATRTLGGKSSPAGSCLWHVIGWEMTLDEWSQNQPRVLSRHHATGILIAALGALKAYYEHGKA